MRWIVVLILAAPVWAQGSCPASASYPPSSGNPSFSLVTLASLGITNGCFYAAASGSDSNTGTDETHPWLHFPGMGGCSSTCAATTPANGTGFILRGGDTWHASNGTPAICGSGPCQWSWSWRSTSSGAPQYIGIDIAWFNNGNCASSTASLPCRPVLSMDNALTTSVPGSCTYDDSAISGLKLTNPVSNSTASYIIVDGLEFTGKCFASNSISNNSVGYFYRTGTNINIYRSYFHGWSMTSTAYDGHAAISGYGGVASDNNGIYSSVIDGVDSTNSTFGGISCTNAVNGSPCNSGWGIQGDCATVAYSIIRFTTNAILCTNPILVHDNLFEFNYATLDGNLNGGPHPNIVENPTDVGLTFTFYNNLVRHNLMNVNVWVEGQNQWIFNNVIFDSGTSAANCVMIQSGTATWNAYIYNNTLNNNDGNGCKVQYLASPSGGNVYYANNHFIAMGGTALTNVYINNSGGTATTNDNGGELYQTQVVANGQGYTNGNNYAPSLGGSTIGAGNNETSSCSAFSADSALCSGTSVGVSEVSGPNSGKYISYPATAINTRPASGAWDAGAYEFQTAPPAPCAACFASLDQNKEWTLSWLAPPVQPDVTTLAYVIRRGTTPALPAPKQIAIVNAKTFNFTDQTSKPNDYYEVSAWDRVVSQKESSAPTKCARQ